MKTKSLFSVIFNDPVGQLLIGLSLFTLLLFVDNGLKPLLVITIVLDVFFVARCVFLLFGKTRVLSKSITRVLEIMDLLVFISTLFLLCKMEAGSNNLAITIYTWVVAGIFLIFILVYYLSRLSKKG